VGLLAFRRVEVWLLYCVFGTPFRASMEGFMLDSFCSGLLCSRALFSRVYFADLWKKLCFITFEYASCKAFRSL